MRLYEVTSSFNRPNTTGSYTIGTVIANSATGANVVPLTWIIPTQGFLLTNVKLILGDGAPTNGIFDLYLFQNNPIVPGNTVADGSFSGAVPESNFLGIITLDAEQGVIGSTRGLIGSTNTSILQIPVDPNQYPIFTDPSQATLGNVYGLIAVSTFALGNYSVLSGELFSITLIGVD